MDWFAAIIIGLGVLNLWKQRRDVSLRLYRIEAHLQRLQVRDLQPRDLPAESPPRRETRRRPRTAPTPPRAETESPVEGERGEASQAEPKLPVDSPPPALLGAASEVTPDQSESPSASETPKPIRRATPVDAGRLEAAIGATWMVRVGAIVLLLGIGFLFKYAWDQEWVTPLQRALSGAAVGLVLHGLAHRFFRRGYDALAQGFAGCGSAVLYLTIFTAYAWYELIGQSFAFGALMGVTLGTVLVAMRHHALALAVLALIGGFLTPALAAGEVANPHVLFSYLGVLAGGFLLLGRLRQWPLLAPLGWVGVASWFVMWTDNEAHFESPWTTSLWATAHFVLFAVALVPSSLSASARVRAGGIAFFGLNAAAWLLLTGLAVAGEDLERWGVLLLGGAAFSFALAELSRPHALVRPVSREILCVPAVCFLLLGLSSALEGRALTLALVAGGVALTGLAVRRWPARVHAAGAVLALALASARAALLHTRLGVDPMRDYALSDLTPFLNPEFAVALAVPAGFLVCARLLPRGREHLVIGAAMGAALLFLRELEIALLETAVSEAAAQSSVLAGRMFATLGFSMVFVWWSRRVSEVPRYVLRGLGLGWLAVGSLCALVLLREIQRPLDLFLLNEALARVLAAPLACALLARWGGLPRGFRVTLWSFVTAFPLLAFSLESWRRFATLPGEIEVGLESGQAALTLTWIAYGAALLVLGLLVRQRPLRLAALALLTVTLLKMVVIDLGFLDPVLRIISFIGLGLVLMTGAWLYHRFAARLAILDARAS